MGGDDEDGGDGDNDEQKDITIAALVVALLALLLGVAALAYTCLKPPTPAPSSADGEAAGAQGRETEGAEAATEGGSIFDQERDMFNIRRKMAACYQLGSYQSALQHAQELRDRAAGLMGRRNAVYASSLNNVALM
ncbi:hypothetical protein B484DRAFT_406854, partial [Ochromonadaceae sp. CCMP2298]